MIRLAAIPSSRSEWAEWGAFVWTAPLQTMLVVAAVAAAAAMSGPKQLRGVAGVVAGGTGVLVLLRVIGVI